MDDEKSIFIASNIEHLRNINKTTQHQLASHLGYVDGAVSNWEKGIRKPDVVDIKKIADYFNVSVDSLINTDMRFSKEQLKTSTIEDVKKSINNLSENDMNAESKVSLINMVDTLHNLSKKE